VTAKGQQVGAVLCVHAKDMKEPWCLATSERDATAATLVNHYSKRWTIEPQFRDTKDLRFGMGLSSTRIGEPTRRDRLLLISAFATALLTRWVKLPRFRGHRTICVRGVHDGQDKSSLSS